MGKSTNVNIIVNDQTMASLEHEELISMYSTVGYKSVHNCRYCHYFSKSITFMRHHVRRHRSSLEIFNCEKNQLEIFSCMKCDFKTAIFMFLRKHLEEVHASDKGATSYNLKDYVCKKCSFQTNSLLHWYKHFDNCENNDVINGNTNGYFKCLHTVNHLICDQCPYKTTNRLDLKEHEYNNRHTSEEEINWFKCGQCSYKSKFIKHLKQHKLSKYCSDSDINCFNYKSKVTQGFKSHKLNKHTSDEDVDWWKCDHCPYRSKNKSGLIRHKYNRHTPQEKINWFKCDQCPYKAKQKSHFENHRFWKHGLLA